MLVVVGRGDRVGPTPETSRKRRDDPILRLVKKGDLIREHLNAIEAIQRAFLFRVGQSLHIPIHRMERTDASPNASERITIGQIRAERAYLKWIDGMVRGKVPIGQVIDIVVMRKSPRMVDRERRQRRGKALTNLQAGLNLYCRLRGWI